MSCAAAILLAACPARSGFYSPTHSPGRSRTMLLPHRKTKMAALSGTQASKGSGHAGALIFIIVTACRGSVACGRHAVTAANSATRGSHMTRIRSPVRSAASRSCIFARIPNRVDRAPHGPITGLPGGPVGSARARVLFHGCHASRRRGGCGATLETQ